MDTKMRNITRSNSFVENHVPLIEEEEEEEVVDVESLHFSKEVLAASNLTQNNLPCHFVMAPSTIPNGGWGIYSLVGVPKRKHILPGGPVIHLVDLRPQHAPGISHLLKDYAWSSQATGGWVEGNAVRSLVPGIGMLANSVRQDFNLAPGTTLHDPAGLFRGASPAAGSSTHHHSTTFRAVENVHAGSELFYGTKSENRLNKIDFGTNRSLDWLLDNGICLDNIEQKESPTKGRGAFATRPIKKGTVVAPLPIEIIGRSSLKMQDQGTHQLLLNYCFGNSKSSLLLFPYGPIVNLINHDSKPNALVRWSDQTSKEWFDMSAQEILKSRHTWFLMEVIALRDIEPGEEVLIDYGPEWQKAWSLHRENFDASMHASENYVYPSVMNDKVQTFRTIEEQNEKPYPNNLQTACFYDYEGTKNYKLPVEDGAPPVRAAEWPLTARTKQRHLLYRYPCDIMGRESKQHGIRYIVEIKNYEATLSHKIVPENERHIVTGVPREYITFIDKLFTTDQNLPNTFRHEIGLPDGVFPEKWMDL